jgi:O-antigen/teichoic acid export membrane protein
VKSSESESAANGGSIDTISSDLRRIVSSTGIYAAAATAQKGVAFLLLPIYTRFIDPAQYGVLELISAFTTVVFLCLGLGLPSAINKCFHRDAPTRRDKRTVLSTAVCLGGPVVVTGTAVLWLLAPWVGRALTHTEDATDLVRLAVLGALFTTLTALFTSSLRTQERALAFSVVNLVQFVAALSLNIAFVVYFGLGIRGVLLGQLASQVLALSVAIGITRRGSDWSFNKRLTSPLIRFGVLLVPAALAGWIMNLSDRFLLGMLADLEEVAVYGVGYKIGRVLEMVIVWPFQLSWPAVSFSISHQAGHRVAYAKVLTYLAAILTMGVLVLSLLSRAIIPVLVGEGYRAAYRVVPLIALGYALNGIHYCVSPGLHLSGKTRYLPVLMAVSAALNVGLNLLLIPGFGMMGAGAATAISFLFLAMGTFWVSKRFYPVPYEYRRLSKIVLAGAVVYSAATLLAPSQTTWNVVWSLGSVLLGFPLALFLLGFFEETEVEAAKSLVASLLSRQSGG